MCVYIYIHAHVGMHVYIYNIHKKLPITIEIKNDDALIKSHMYYKYLTCSPNHQ